MIPLFSDGVLCEGSLVPIACVVLPGEYDCRVGIDYYGAPLAACGGEGSATEERLRNSPRTTWSSDRPR